MATIKDVAAKAGVSIGTVSNVVTGNRFVSSQTTGRVREAMTELGFSPNGVASSLRSRRTRTIGLIVPDNANPFFAEIARAIEQANTAVGFGLMLCNTQRSPELAAASVRLLVEKRVDGIILAAATDAETLRPAVAAGVPIVLVDSDVPGVRADAVFVDHGLGGELAARHLFELGHREIACITGFPTRACSRERLAGFRAVLHRVGVALPDARVAESDFHADTGYRATLALLDRDPAITAIFAVNDLAALGTIRACHDRGRAVPDRVSVIGFDDIGLADLMSPRLSTIRQPISEIGRLAIEVLAARLADPARAEQRSVLPVELVARESTAPLSEACHAVPWNRRGAGGARDAAQAGNGRYPDREERPT